MNVITGGDGSHDEGHEKSARDIFKNKVARLMELVSIVFPQGYHGVEPQRTFSLTVQRFAESARNVVLDSALFSDTLVIDRAADAKEISGLAYLAANRAVKTIKFPDADFDAEVKELIQGINTYVIAHCEETLTQSQILARMIGNPASRREGGGRGGRGG